jgi:hypothetical protein
LPTSASVARTFRALLAKPSHAEAADSSLPR